MACMCHVYFTYLNKSILKTKKAEDIKGINNVISRDP